MEALGRHRTAVDQTERLTRPDDAMMLPGDSGQVQPTDEETGHPSDAPPHADEAWQQDAEPPRRHPSGFLATTSGRRRRSRWIMVGAVIGAAGLLAALFGFGLSRDPSIWQSPLLGRRAPDFALPMLDGGRVIRFSELRGKVVVINFWASWCAACREEHPNLLAAWGRYRDQGVVLLGIDYQDSPTAARAFMKQMGGDWPILVDPGSRVAIEYGVYGVPETFFMGRDGVVHLKQIGPSSYALLTDEIHRLLEPGG